MLARQCAQRIDGIISTISAAPKHVMAFAGLVALASLESLKSLWHAGYHFSTPYVETSTRPHQNILDSEY